MTALEKIIEKKHYNPEYGGAKFCLLSFTEIAVHFTI